MNNYPGYAQPRSGNLFPAYGRPQLRSAHHSNFRPQNPQPYNNEFLYNCPRQYFNQPPFQHSNPPPFPNSRLPLVRPVNLNENSNFRQLNSQINNCLNADVYTTQRIPHQYKTNIHPLLNIEGGQDQSVGNVNKLFSEKDISNYDQRLLSNPIPFNDCSKRQRIDMGYGTDAVTLKNQSVSCPSFKKETFLSGSDSFSIKDSSSFINAVTSVADSLYSDVPSPKHVSIKEDILLNEFKEQNQQQELKKLLDSQPFSVKKLEHSPIQEENSLVVSVASSLPTHLLSPDIFPNERNKNFKNMPASDKTLDLLSGIPLNVKDGDSKSFDKGKEFSKSAPVFELSSEKELVSPSFDIEKLDSVDPLFCSTVPEKFNKYSEYSNSPIVTTFLSHCITSTSDTSSPSKDVSSLRAANEPAFLSLSSSKWDTKTLDMDNNENASKLIDGKESNIFDTAWDSQLSIEKDKISQHNVPNNDTSNTSQYNAFSNRIASCEAGELNLTDITKILSSLQESLDSQSKSKLNISEDCVKDNEWSRSNAIPFLGDAPDDISDSNSMSYPDSNAQEISPSKNVNVSTSSFKSGKNKPKSTLEDALNSLDIQDPIIGLGYIIEHKNNLIVDGGFAFRCNLCNSSITRPLIIDHILGSKHRLRFMKLKDEDTYNFITKLNVPEKERDVIVCEAATRMEKIFGHGIVTIEFETTVKDSKRSSPITMNLKKIQDQSHSLMLSDFESHHEDNTQTNENKEIKKEACCSKPIEIESPSLQNSGSLSPKTEINKEIPNLENDMYSSNHKDFVQEPECSNQSPKVVEESLPLPSVKRPASPCDQSVQHKVIKKVDELNNTDLKLITENMETDIDSTCSISSNLNNQGSTEDHQEIPLADLLEQLTKTDISSEEEAKSITQATDVLLKMLLRYKLRKVVCEDKEKLTNSLLNATPGKLDELLFSAKLKSSTEDEKSRTSELIRSNSFSTNSNLPMTLMENQVSASSIEQNETQNSTASTIVENALPSNEDLLKPNISNLSVNQSSGKDQGKLVSSNVGNLQCVALTQTATTISVAPLSSNSLLQPPPFFSFANSNTSTSNIQTPASTVAPSSLVWSSPYHSQMNFFQQPAYAGTPTMYQPYGMAMPQFMPMQMSMLSQGGQFAAAPLVPLQTTPPLPLPQQGLQHPPPLPDVPPPLPATTQLPLPPPPPEGS